MFIFQDAHELYHVFTETLEEEAAKYPSVLPLFDAHKIEVKHQWGAFGGGGEGETWRDIVVQTMVTCSMDSIHGVSLQRNAPVLREFGSVFWL